MTCRGVVVGLTVVACSSGTVPTVTSEGTTSTTTTIVITTTHTSSAPTTTSLPGLPAPITSDGAGVVDLADREIARLQILGGPDWMVEGFGSIWVKLDRGVVLRISPENNSIVAEIPVTQSGCAGIGASPGAIWTCSRDFDQPVHVARIDPESDQVAEVVVVGKAPDQARFVYSNLHVWVLNGPGDLVRGIDPTSNTFGPEIDLGTRCTELAAGGDVLWAACPIEGMVVRIDPDGEVVHTPPIFNDARTISVGEFVFVGFRTGTAQLDPETLEVLAVYEAAPGLLGSLWADRGDLWIRQDDGPYLTRIDPATLTVVETIETDEIASGGDVLAAFDSIWTTAFDANVLIRLAPA